MYHKALEMLVIIAVTLMGIQGVATQTSNVTCSSSFGWASNSLNQTPCLVSSYLEAVCSDGEWVTPSLPDGYSYSGPTVSDANSCECSSVVYSLLSACAACQNQLWITWATWISNCPTAYLGQYPDPIPHGTLIPAWAYLNITAVGGTFSVTAAQQDLSAPASSAAVVQSTAGSSPTTTPSSSPKPSSSNTGAIVGGVVGGVAGLAIVVVGVVWFMRRCASGAQRHLHEKPSFDSSPMGQTISPYRFSHPAPAPTPASHTKIYNPDDPSTFPHSLNPSTTYTNNISGFLTPSPGIPPDFQAMQRPGYYNGVPEI